MTQTNERPVRELKRFGNEEIESWLNKSFPMPQCWYNMCGEEEGEYCEHLDWFAGKRFLDVSFDDAGHVDKMMFCIENGHSWNVYIGEIGYLHLCMEITGDGETGSFIYAVKLLEHCEFPVPENYYADVWNFGADNGTIGMLEAEEFDRRERLRKAEAAKKDKEARKVRAQKVKDSQLSMF